MTTTLFGRCAGFAAALLAALVLAAPAGLRAQGCPLGLSAVRVPVDQLTIADFDVDHFEARGLLFTVNISNAAGADIQTQLRIALAIELAEGLVFPAAALMLSDPFQVPSAGRTLTNLDLGQGRGIGFESFDIDDAARDAVEDRTLSSGLLPAGVYTFTFSLDGCDAVPVEVVIVIGNSSRVELLSPREGEGTGPFPFFEFYHEGRAARLTVAELAPGRSPEDAIERDPPMLRADLGTERTLLYSGGRPLERGKTYVWRVQTLSRVAGGATVDLSSPVWSFTVTEEGSWHDALLARLEAMYGAQYPDIFRAIRDGGFRPTGDFSLDGSALAEAELLRVLDALQEALDSSELSFD